MSLTDDLYREIILEHFKSPRNHGHLDQAQIFAQGANPFCGDDLEVTVTLDGETIREIRFKGTGCSISQSSASMMTEAVNGKTLQEAEGLAKKFKAVMLESAPAETLEPEEDLRALEGVKKYPVRIKCAILSWNTLLDGIHAHRKGETKAMHIEGEEGEHTNLAQASETPPAADAGQAAAPQTPPAQEDRPAFVREALKGVIDPELNMNIVDLGLIYDVQVQGEAVKVIYSLTSPGCPLGPVIKGQIHSVLGRVPWIKEIQPELVWSPPWDPKTMASEEAKTELGIW